MTSAEWLGDAALLDHLRTGELTVQGRLTEASNATLRCDIDAADGRSLTCVYKPVAGERGLWDFPVWTLSHREIAAYAVSEALGWHLVPPTVWREDGPAGAGMCQLWIDEDGEAAQVGIVRPGQAPNGWLTVLDAEDGAGAPVQLVHASSEPLLRMAVFDAVVNNADRKGGHVITDLDGRTWGIDHGVCFSVDEKLRTVLWGWSGAPLPDGIVESLTAFEAVLGHSFDPVDRWLGEDERDRLRHRLHSLLAGGSFPTPSPAWPAIPWPVF